MKQGESKSRFQLYDNRLRRAFSARVRRWQHRHHISCPDLAFDLIALRRKMRFYWRIEICLFNRFFNGFSDGAYPFRGLWRRSTPILDGLGPYITINL